MDTQLEGKEYWENRPPEDQRKDWKDDADWLDGYWNSREHPHRRLIVEALRTVEPFGSVFEIGCNCGPNLDVIQGQFTGTLVGGVDLNRYAIMRAGERILGGDFHVGSATELPAQDKGYDVVLEDAALMYVGPDEIGKVADEIDRVAKKGVVICDWFGDSPEGEVKNHHWTRDYRALLEQKGFKVVFDQKITETEWPSENWVANGRVCALVRA